MAVASRFASVAVLFLFLGTGVFAAQSESGPGASDFRQYGNATPTSIGAIDSQNGQMIHHPSIGWGCPNGAGAFDFRRAFCLRIPENTVEPQAQIAVEQTYDQSLFMPRIHRIPEPGQVPIRGEEDHYQLMATKVRVHALYRILDENGVTVQRQASNGVTEMAGQFCGGASVNIETGPGSGVKHPDAAYVMVELLTTAAITGPNHPCSTPGSGYLNGWQAEDGVARINIQDGFGATGGGGGGSPLPSV